MKLKLTTFFLLLFLLVSLASKGQETIFSLFKSDFKLGNVYFREMNFQRALTLYSNAKKKNPNDGQLGLKIAQCHYFLKQYIQSINEYDNYLKTHNDLPLIDLFYYAEAQSGIANYAKAIEYYKYYLSKVPNNELVLKKIWQLSNIQYLYEDSLHYTIRPVSLNTNYSELCAVPFKHGLVFISNRKEIKPIEKLDAALNTPFYHIYYSQIFSDTARNSVSIYSKPSIFANGFSAKFHTGPVAFYNREANLVYITTNHAKGEEGSRTLRLYFAEFKNGKWKTVRSFPYNSNNYSISDPAISEDGKVLYFSSDMKGGFGGRDIYQSKFIDNQWTKPINLGELINTTLDERFPYLHRNKALYFSSNGHAGLGGLDIFKSEINNGNIDEPKNVGYPLNTCNDEFGVFIDSLDTHGYFSSNRKMGGQDDDIYEFEMDIQQYPFAIKGQISYKELSWNDTVALKVMPFAKLYLIDIIRNIPVYEVTADREGNFSMNIPYFTKYKIRVVASDDAYEDFVSLEIQKYRSTHNKHEIVIIKDEFNRVGSQTLK